MLRLLLRFYPADFRRRFGDDLTDAFRDRRNAARARGRLAVAACWVRMTIDSAAHGLAERRLAHATFSGGSSMWSALVQDLRYTARTLRRRPGFTTVALVTFALGLGANTAIFSVVEAALLRPLPYPDAERLVRVYETNPRFGFYRGVTTPFNVDAWEREARSFARLAALRSSAATLTGTGEPVRVVVQFVTPAFFEVMGVPPALGRVLTTDDAAAARPVVVLTHGLWERQFSSDLAVVGRPMTLDGQVHTIVGVLPTGFRYPSRTELFRPLDVTPAMRSDMASYHLSVVARLTPGATVETAQAEMDAITGRLAARFPRERGGRGAAVVGLRVDLFERFPGSLRLLQGVTLFVLLIACANVANLGLAGASARRREIGIRVSMGAGRGRLVRQWLTEHIAVALGGSVIGILLAAWSVRAMVALAPAGLLPDAAAPGLNLTVLAFTFVLALASGLVAGVAPAWWYSGRDALDAIKDGSAASAGTSRRSQRWLRAGLVTAEVALALVLVTGSLLLVRSFERIVSQEPGFDTDRLLTAQITLPAARYDGPDAQRAFWTALFERLDATPGVRSATGSTALPFSNWQWQTWFELDGGQVEGTDSGAGTRTVTAGYFGTLGIPVRQGRDFTPADRATADPVVIVNDVFARRFVNGDPIGRRLRTERPDASARSEVLIGTDQGPEYSARWATIVGVAASSRHGRLDAEPEPEIYRPLPQSSAASLILALRTTGDPASLAPLLRDAVRALDRDLPVEAVRTMDEAIGLTTARRNFDLRLITSFAVLAAGLAAAGIYGVMAFLAGLRIREAGIRLALGASPREVQRLFVRQGGRPVVAGIAIGIVAALFLGDVLQDQLFEIEPNDPVALSMAAAAFLIIGLVASWLPAHRAATVDPAVTLRGDGVSGR